MAANPGRRLRPARSHPQPYGQVDASLVGATLPPPAAAVLGCKALLLCVSDDDQ